jgi:hypothetical protein
VIDVRCGTCLRQERWAEDGAVVVIAEGGHRRPAVDPQWQRGRTALASYVGEVGPVVAVCAGCGQWLVATSGSPARIPVRIDTPAGPLTVDEQIAGPNGPLSREEAEGFLKRQYHEGWASELRQLPKFALFFVLLGPLAMWIFGVLFVASFLLSVYQGPAAPVSGPVNW